MANFKPQRYSTLKDGLQRLRRDLEFIFRNLDEKNITGINSTAINVACNTFGCNGTTGSTNIGLSADLSTALGAVASSDLNRTNGQLNEIKNLLITFGLGSS
jgi:hypothetical protein